MTAKQAAKAMSEGAVLHVQFGAERFYWLTTKKGSRPVPSREAEQLINSGLLMIRDRGRFEGKCAQSYELNGRGA